MDLDGRLPSFWLAEVARSEGPHAIDLNIETSRPRRKVPENACRQILRKETSIYLVNDGRPIHFSAIDIALQNPCPGTKPPSQGEVSIVAGRIRLTLDRSIYHFSGGRIKGYESQDIMVLPSHVTAEVGAFQRSRYVDKGSTRMIFLFMRWLRLRGATVA